MIHIVRHGQRGAALAAVVAASVVFSVSAAAVLTMGLHRTRTARFNEHRLRAKYAAEAGLVWALQRFWDDPSKCNSMNVINPDLTVGGLDVDVTIDDCAADPLVIHSEVIYDS